MPSAGHPAVLRRASASASRKRSATLAREIRHPAHEHEPAAREERQRRSGGDQGFRGQLVRVEDLAIPAGGLVVGQERRVRRSTTSSTRRGSGPWRRRSGGTRPAAASRRRALTSSSEPFEGEADDGAGHVDRRLLHGLTLAGQGLRHLPRHLEIGPLVDAVLLPEDLVLLEILEGQGQSNDQAGTR